MFKNFRFTANQNRDICQPIITVLLVFTKFRPLSSYSASICNAKSPNMGCGSVSRC